MSHNTFVYSLVAGILAVGALSIPIIDKEEPKSLPFDTYSPYVLKDLDISQLHESNYLRELSSWLVLISDHEFMDEFPIYYAMPDDEASQKAAVELQYRFNKGAYISTLERDSNNLIIAIKISKS